MCIANTGGYLLRWWRARAWGRSSGPPQTNLFQKSFPDCGLPSLYSHEVPFVLLACCCVHTLCESSAVWTFCPRTWSCEILDDTVQEEAVVHILRHSPAQRAFSLANASKLQKPPPLLRKFTIPVQCRCYFQKSNAVFTITKFCCRGSEVQFITSIYIFFVNVTKNPPRCSFFKKHFITSIFKYIKKLDFTVNTYIFN